MLSRVTEILKPLTDYSHINPSVLEAAADRGTKVHYFAEQIAKGEFLPPVPDALVGYVSAFQEWFIEYVEHVELVEERFEDKALGFTGQIDLVVRIKGDDKLSLVDIKTPSSPQKHWGVQLAAYKHLLKINGIEAARRLVLKLSREGDARIIEYTDDPYDWNIFQACLIIHRFKTGG